MVKRQGELFNMQENKNETKGGRHWMKTCTVNLFDLLFMTPVNGTRLFMSSINYLIKRLFCFMTITPEL